MIQPGEFVLTCDHFGGDVGVHGLLEFGFEASPDVFNTPWLGSIFGSEVATKLKAARSFLMFSVSAFL